MAHDLFNFCQMPFQFDPEKLNEELSRIKDTWGSEQPFIMEDAIGPMPTIYHQGNWKILSLRSQGGDIKRTDPGGPGLRPFQDTVILEKSPYFKEVLATLKTELRSVRLSSLEPGIVIAEHCDTFHHFHFGQVRMHIPIITDPKVEFFIDNEKKYMPPGELWYCDFSKMHKVQNYSDKIRIHMILDVIVNDFIIKLFPEEYIEKIGYDNIIKHEPEIAMSEEQLKKYECNFIIPPALITGFFNVDDGVSGHQFGSIKCVDSKLIFHHNNKPLIAIYPVSETQFNFTGWIGERYFEFNGNQQNRNLSLVFRKGKHRIKTEFAMI